MNKFLFYAGALIVVFLPVPVAILTGSAANGGLCFLSGTLSVFFSRLDSLEEFSLGPLKAKLRRAIDEANATVEQLRDLGCQLSDAILSQLVSSEMLGVHDSKDKHVLKGRIISCLTDLGVSSTQKEQAQRGWKRGISVLYVRRIESSIFDDGVINENKKDGELEALDEIHSHSNMFLWDVPNSDIIRAILVKHSVSKPLLNKLLDDYQRFLETSEVQSIDRLMGTE